MTDHTLNPDFRLVTILAGLAGRHDKIWSYPAQQTLCRLLGQFYSRRMSRRSVNRHLGGLVRDGWITRRRRHCAGPDGELELHSTLYTLTRRTIRCLAGLRSCLAFLGGTAPRNAGIFRCANSGTISDLTDQSRGSGARTSPPDTPQSDPLAMLAGIKQILRRR